MVTIEILKLSEVFNIETNDLLGIKKDGNLKSNPIIVKEQKVHDTVEEFKFMANNVLLDEEKEMSLVPCANYHCLAIVPRYEVKTSQARKVLPTGMAFKDCVSQVSHALVFIQALQQGNESLLASSCRDLLHEPYRRQFIKEYDRIKKYCDLKQLPMWISGSGSTMMVVSLEKSHLVELSKILESCFSELDYRFLTIAKEGAFIKYE